MELIIKVVAVIGRCPAYKVGDRIVIKDGYRVNLKETTAICMHSLVAIMPYYVALNKGLVQLNWDLQKKETRPMFNALIPANIQVVELLFLK